MWEGQSHFLASHVLIDGKHLSKGDQQQIKKKTLLALRYSEMKNDDYSYWQHLLLLSLVLFSSVIGRRKSTQSIRNILCENWANCLCTYYHQLLWAVLHIHRSESERTRARERERVLVQWCRSSKTKSERIIIIDWDTIDRSLIVYTKENVDVGDDGDDHEFYCAWLHQRFLVYFFWLLLKKLTSNNCPASTKKGK